MSWGAIYTKTHFGETSSDNGWGFFYPAAVKIKAFVTDITTVLIDAVSYLTDQTTYK